MQDIAIFIVFFLLPGLALLVFAPRLKDLNARLFPRLYGPREQAGALFVYYVVGMIWIVLGFVTFIMHQ